jgi:hypothetical protein
MTFFYAAAACTFSSFLHTAQAALRTTVRTACSPEMMAEVNERIKTMGDVFRSGVKTEAAYRQFLASTAEALHVSEECFLKTFPEQAAEHGIGRRIDFSAIRDIFAEKVLNDAPPATTALKIMQEATSTPAAQADSRIYIVLGAAALLGLGGYALYSLLCSSKSKAT